MMPGWGAVCWALWGAGAAAGEPDGSAPATPDPTGSPSGATHDAPGPGSAWPTPDPEWPTPDPAAEWADRAVDPADPARIVVLRRDGAVFRSEDQGRSWALVLGPAPQRISTDRVPLPLELEPPELPDPESLEDPDDYVLRVREALEEAEARRARAVEQLRLDREAGRSASGIGDLRVWFGPDALWVVRQDGARRSLDQGTTWSRARGTSPPAGPSRPEGDLPTAAGSVDARGPTPAGPGARGGGDSHAAPWSAGGTGSGAGDGPDSGEAPGWVPREVLVQSALARAALDPVRAPRSARALPSVALVVRRYDHHDQDLDDGGSSGWFDAAVVLEWGLGRGAGLDPALTDPDLVEIDGRWLVDDGTPDPVLARAIARHGADYRAGLVTGVGRLYAARQRLASAPDGKELLLDRVLRELRLQELDARLDFVSGGAVTAWSRTDERHRVEPGDPREPGDLREPSDPREPGAPHEPGDPREPSAPREPSDPPERGHPDQPRDRGRPDSDGRGSGGQDEPDPHSERDERAPG